VSRLYVYDKLMNEQQTACKNMERRYVIMYTLFRAMN